VITKEKVKSTSKEKKIPKEKHPQNKKTLNLITRIHTFSKNPKEYNAKNKIKETKSFFFSFSFKDLNNQKV